MSISSEKLYTEPGSIEEQELQEEQERVHRRRNTTGAKKGNGKKVALTILVVGGLVAASIFGTKAYHSLQETRRVDRLLESYQVENYISLPNEVISDRAYDVTYANGSKVVDRLEERNVDYININGQFYTKDGIDIKLLTYEVIYDNRVDSIKVTSDGTTLYMPPVSYGIHDRDAWKGSESTKYETMIRTVVVPADLDLSLVSFPGACEWNLADEPVLLHTLPYSVIENSTLICDVPDNATLNENNECVGTLDLAPKKR